MTDHLTDIEALRVALFAQEVGIALHLPRYKYVVLQEPCRDEALATVSCVTDRWIAEIALNPPWMVRDEEERIHTIVHEVCHLLHRGVDQAVAASTSFMHPHEFDSVWEGYRRQSELMVDFVSMFIADFTTIKSSWAAMEKEAKKQLKLSASS